MTPAEFKTSFPEFATSTDPQVQAAIIWSLPFLDEARWGGLYSAGLGYAVAHKLTLSRDATKRAGCLNGNDIVSKSFGSVSTSRSGEVLSAQVADPFLRTTYGQEYRALANLVGLGGCSP